MEVIVIDIDEQDRTEALRQRVAEYTQHIDDCVKNMLEGTPMPNRQIRNGARNGRNSACPCGSGKKFKKCCMTKGGV